MGSQCHAVEACDRQGDEGLDAVAHELEGGDEGGLLVDVGAFDMARVLDAPMGIGRVAEPHRAGFTGCVVADCEDEIHLRRAVDGELVPGLRSETV